MTEQSPIAPGEDSMERMMDGMNGGMETTPMPDVAATDGMGAVERPRPQRPSRPKAARKRKPKAKAKARKPARKRSKAKTRAKARKSGGTRTKKRGRR